MTTGAFEEVEYRLLCRAVTDACRLLAGGDLAAGYRCLRAGLDRARELAEAGEAWAFALVAAYRSALLQYASLAPPGRGARVAPPVRPGAAWDRQRVLQNPSGPAPARD